MPSPLVSVVVRNYNRVERVLRALESVVAQTFTDYEILFVDDASTDDSVARVHERFAHVEQLKILENPINQGAAGAANIGVEMAEGKYIAFLDSDDTWAPDFLEAHVLAHRENPHCVVSYCDYMQVWDDYQMERFTRCQVSDNQRRDALLGCFIHSMSMTMTLREAIVQLGGFDKNYSVSHDYFLWVSIALLTEEAFFHIARPLVGYRVSADGVTAHYDQWQIEYVDAVQRAYTHPAALPYKENCDKACEQVSLAIYARQQVVLWLARNTGQRVSIILLTGNRSENLQRALNCVQQQTYQNRELVIVDNASDDDTAIWLLAKADPNTKVIRLGEVHTQAAALNIGVGAATGELVAFLEDDCEWSEEYLQHQVRANSFVINEPIFTLSDYHQGQFGEDTLAPREHTQTTDNADLLAQHLFDPYPHHWSFLMLRRVDYLAVGGVDAELSIGGLTHLTLNLLCHAALEYRGGRSERSPVFVRQCLGIHWLDKNASQQSLQDFNLQASLIYKSFFDSEVGSNYRFLAHEVITQCLIRNTPEI